MRFAAVWLAVLLVLLVTVAGVACGGGDDNDGAGVRVVATTAIVGEFATRVAGPDARVDVLMPAGVDVHSFELPTDAVRRIARADLVLVNGYGLEEDVLEALVENRKQGARVVAAARGLEPLAASIAANEDENPRGRGDETVDPATFAAGDPHYWLAVPNAIRYVENIRDALVAADPARAEGYRTRAGALIEELRALDAHVRARIGEVPAERRKLVVFHDAFGYFAREYGLQLVASVVPAGANTEPSAADVSSVVRTVRAERIPAVYREPQFSSRSVEVVARETGARALTLYSDAYAEGVRSYDQLMRANADAIVEGLR